MSEREAWQVTDDASVLYEKCFVPAIFAGSAAMVAELATIAPGERVLDVGCGTGVLAREAARRVGANGRVVGLDLNPAMLAVARRIAPEIAWRHGDAGALPFEDGAFDAALSQYALMFFPDRAQALREMWRVLRPGGRLVVAVCGALADTAGYRALAEVAEGVCTPEVVGLLRSPFVLGDPEQMAQLAETAGLQGATIRTIEVSVRFASIDALVHTEVRASPIRAVIDERSFDALLEGARERLAPLCADGKEVRFAMPAHVLSARKG